MARDRDHRAVAHRTLQDGRALLKAWGVYVDKTRALANVVACSAVDRDTGLPCQLVEGHRKDKGTRHRHRPLGSVHGTVEWD